MFAGQRSLEDSEQDADRHCKGDGRSVGVAMTTAKRSGSEKGSDRGSVTRITVDLDAETYERLIAAIAERKIRKSEIKTIADFTRAALDSLLERDGY